MTGWDCHAHLFGPYQQFPLSADRSYTPPEAVLGQYLQLLERLALKHGVLVQPSAYGPDHSLLLSALETAPHLRGVTVVKPDELAGLLANPSAGVQRLRAARFSHRSAAGANFAGSASLHDLKQMAHSLADAGWHAELWTDCKVLPAIEADLAALPLPVVIDHMGGFDVQQGVNEPGFVALLRLLESGKVWVKLCVYRNLLGQATLASGRVFHQMLMAANPQRLIWGSDWPHLRVAPVPDAAGLLNTFKTWTADDTLVQQVLKTNPALLYR